MSAAATGNINRFIHLRACVIFSSATVTLCETGAGIVLTCYRNSSDLATSSAETAPGEAALAAEENDIEPPVHTGLRPRAVPEKALRILTLAPLYSLVRRNQVHY